MTADTVVQLNDIQERHDDAGERVFGDWPSADHAIAMRKAWEDGGQASDTDIMNKLHVFIDGTLVDNRKNEVVPVVLGIGGICLENRHLPRYKPVLAIVPKLSGGLWAHHRKKAQAIRATLLHEVTAAVFEGFRDLHSILVSLSGDDGRQRRVVSWVGALLGDQIGTSAALGHKSWSCRLCMVPYRQATDPAVFETRSIVAERAIRDAAYGRGAAGGAGAAPAARAVYMYARQGASAAKWAAHRAVEARMAATHITHIAVRGWHTKALMNASLTHVSARGASRMTSSRRC